MTKQKKYEAYEECINKARTMNKDKKWGIPDSMLSICLMVAKEKGLFNPEKLLTFNDFNFKHDIVGMINHWDFEGTGDFDNTFRPRSAEEL